MKRNFFIAGFITTIVNLILHAGNYLFFLKAFFEKHPSVSVEFTKQLARPPDQLIKWAMVVTSLSMGFLITIAMKWSRAYSFLTGLKNGFLFSLLFWSSVNFGLYASSNHFSTPGVFADLACSVTAMTISAGVAGWVLGRDKKSIRININKHIG